MSHCTGISNAHSAFIPGMGGGIADKQSFGSPQGPDNGASNPQQTSDPKAIDGPGSDNTQAPDGQQHHAGAKHQVAGHHAAGHQAGGAPNKAGAAQQDGANAIDGKNQANGADQKGKSDPSTEAKEKELIDEINKARAKKGLDPVTKSPNLTAAAQENDAENNKRGIKGIGHHVPLEKHGSSGEITAMGTAGLTAKQAVDMWDKSPGHAAIMYNPNLKHVGASNSGQSATADFS